MSYRVGVVSYLNAKPLTWALERGEIAGVEAVAAVPSDLGVMLAAGELDAALLSTVVALRDPICDRSARSRSTPARSPRSRWRACCWSGAGACGRRTTSRRRTCAPCWPSTTPRC
jgi:hypothetical protein